MPERLGGAKHRGGKQPLCRKRRREQPGPIGVPGSDDLSGRRGDGQSPPHPAGLVVVIDQVVGAVDDLDAANLRLTTSPGRRPVSRNIR